MAKKTSLIYEVPVTEQGLLQYKNHAEQELKRIKLTEARLLKFLQVVDERLKEIDRGKNAAHMASGVGGL